MSQMNCKPFIWDAVTPGTDEQRGLGVEDVMDATTGGIVCDQ